MTHRRRAPLAWLLGAALLLGGCQLVPPASPAPPAPPGGAGNPYALLADLAREPAAGLQLPGADEILPTGGEERGQRLGRPQPAEIGGFYGTQAPAGEVFAYYDRELRARGYVPATQGFLLATAELDLRGWCKPGVATYRLDIEDQALAFEPRVLGGRTYTTVYRTFLTGLLPTEACPAPAP